MKPPRQKSHDFRYEIHGRYTNLEIRHGVAIRGVPMAIRIGFAVKLHEVVSYP